MRVLVTGASGQLGAYVVRNYLQRDGSIIAWSGRNSGEVLGVPLQPVELARAEEIKRNLNAAQPDVIIHCAAMSAVGEAFQNPAQAATINTAATAQLAEWATNQDCRLIYISTDMVFDGEKGNYREQDAAQPLSCYGRTKLDGEALVLASPRGLVMRVSLLYGTSLVGRPTFIEQLLASLREGKPFRLFDDEWRTPLDLATAAAAIATAAESDTSGLLHLGGATKLTRYEMGLRIAKAAGIQTQSIETASRLSVAGAEPRPKDLSLDSSRFESIYPQVVRPDFEDSLRCYLPG